VQFHSAVGSYRDVKFALGHDSVEGCGLRVGNIQHPTFNAQ
jgi:hypothetical protein